MHKWSHVAGSLTVFCAAALSVAQAPSFVLDQVFESASMQAYGWGISGFEQKKSSTGEISFVPHPVMGHTPKILAVDLNSDGAIDLVTSTRSGTYIFWSNPQQKKAGKK